MPIEMRDVDGGIGRIFVISGDLLMAWQTWVIYAVLLIVTVALFFLCMWTTHRVLAAEKRSRLDRARHSLAQSIRQLEAASAAGGESLSAENRVRAWSICRNEVAQARTWPYDTETLRTLSVTVLTPIFIGLARVVSVSMDVEPDRN